MEFHLEHIIGRSAAILDVIKMVKKVACTDATVLITGDSGTGKELIARAIHVLSNRKEKVFLPVNCGALPGTLLESLLFGHLKGSFTGASNDRPGLFEQACGGTIFLDEAGEMPLHLQVKLLRVLEAKEILLVGSTTPVRIDVRVLAATHRALPAEVEAGRFREDLYYRLNLMEIHIPPLRERPEDIPPLVDYLIKKHNPELKKNFQGVDSEALRALVSFPWNGNVRELDNVIERAMILADGERIMLKDLPAAIVSNGHGHGHGSFTYVLKEAVKRFERQYIAHVLNQVGEDRREAARLLDISLSSLYQKIKELGIE